MNDVYTYQIELQGQVDDNDLNATSPIHMSVVQADKTASRLSARTDQSGLIGLIRHLHARGYVIMSINSDRPSKGTQTAHNR